MNPQAFAAQFAHLAVFANRIPLNRTRLSPIPPARKTYILHRSAADATRNAAQALDPCATSSTDGVGNGSCPKDFSGADIEENLLSTFAGTLFYAPDRDNNTRPGQPESETTQVAATPEHKKWQGLFSSVRNLRPASTSVT